jgi:hypothetical protein
MRDREHCMFFIVHGSPRMSRFDKRYGKAHAPGDEAAWARPGGQHDDTRYPGDEFGGTYGYRDPRDFGGSPYEAGHEQRRPGHRDFGGHHGYDSDGQHPGHRDFGRDESHSYRGPGSRDWSGSGYPGGQRGVGPKDYERTDERIRDDVCERLTEHDAIDASNIEVRVTAGVVQLSGDVPHRFMKHLAEDAVAEAVGVKDVENTLRVRGSEHRRERGLFDEPSLG